MNDWRWHGRVISGEGKGAGFTQLPWARQGLVEHLGIDPFPGTLNVLAGVAGDSERLMPPLACRLPAPDPSQCDVVCYRVRLDGRLPAAIVQPLVQGYPADRLEIIAAVNLRQTLQLGDGSELSLAGGRHGPLRAVVFDVDGTLVDSLEGYRVAASLAAAPHGYTVRRQHVVAALNGNHAFWELVVPADALTPGLIEQLRADTMRHWPQVVAEQVECVPGIRECLDALLAQDLRLAICTGSRGESFGPLAKAGLFERFETVVTADDVGRRKPHPDGLLRCLDDLGVAPGEAAYVGDTAMDIAAARAAGMLAIGVLTGAASSADLTIAGADLLLGSHAGLPALGLSAPGP